MNNSRIAALVISGCLFLGACNTGNGLSASNSTDNPLGVDIESEASSMRPEIVETDGTSKTADVSDVLEFFVPDKNFDPEPLIAKEKNAHDCITETYAEADIVNHFIHYFHFSILQSHLGFLQQIHEIYPIQYLHRTDNNNMYAVYKTKEGGMYYVFFHNFHGELPWATDNDGNGLWSISESVYITKTLSHADFSDIQIGDPISKVKALEPAVGSLEKINSVTEDGKRYSHSTHILTDGLQYISYEAPEGEEMRVTNMTFYEDFTTSYEEEVREYGTYTLKHNLKIEPEDYPKQ